MEINSKYKIETSEIGDLYRSMDQKELVYAPYYQRNFVWKEGHQQEFIRTILLGYPCPEIFMAEGERDLETHKKYMHVIDGQQRLTTIKRFLDNELQVDNRYYRDLSIEEQSNVSNYELGTVILRLNPEQDIKEIEEIFRRLNRNNYSLNELINKYDLKSTADMKRQDEVEQITIGGKSMESGKKYPPDAKVIITYHSAENKRIF